MKKQFTLIELIIVIVVIGILAAMAMPKFNGVVREAKLSAMINDKEVLEKTMILYYQKHDKLPLLNEDQELIVLNNDISLVKLVQAEEAQNNDIKTIYTSLQETLKHYNDDEENLYRIDIKEINNSLSKKLKYGTKKEDKDFYVYSTKTKNVYYYNTMFNGEGEIQHDEFNTKLKTSELVNKKFSYNLSKDGTIINNKPIVELTTNLSNLTTDSIIKWTYKFTDEDKAPTKISFILNDVEYDDFDNIPTQLDGDEYIIKLKMQDSKGLWSDEIVKTFNVSKDILTENINLYRSNGIGGSYKSIGFFNKQGEFIVTNKSDFEQSSNTFYLHLVYSSTLDYKKLDLMSIKVKTSLKTIYSDILTNKGWIYPTNSKEYSIPLNGISKQNSYKPPIISDYILDVTRLKSELNESTQYWSMLEMKLEKNN